VIEASALKPLNVETALEYGAMILNN
jgi:hypothetical protein